jgi:hypothetical protein
MCSKIDRDRKILKQKERREDDDIQWDCKTYVRLFV